MSQYDSDDWIGALATDLLATAVGCWTDDCGRTAPDRRVIVVGPPALDCEMVAVAVGPVEVNRFEAGARAGVAGCAVSHQANLTVWLARCVPTLDDRGRPPDPVDETQAAVGVARDIALIANGLAQAAFDGLLLPSFVSVPCSGIAWGQISPQAPQGGMVAVAFPVRFERSGLRYS